MRRAGPISALILALSCAHPNGKPGTIPTQGTSAQPKPEGGVGGPKILISKEDLPPADTKQFFYVFPAVTGRSVAEAIEKGRGPILPNDTRSWCIRLKLHRLTPNDRKELARRVGVKDRHKEYLQLRWPSEPSRGVPTAIQKEPSFVVDYDDPRFADVWKSVVAKWGEHPKVDELESFVAEYINIKTTTRRFDTASEVAQSHSGDCSEHAALLTALLRRSGKAARIATGLLVIVERDTLGAFGHAWTEWYDRDQWRVADAAMHPVPGQSADELRAKRYVPVVRLLDEGPGFSAAMGNVRSIEAVSGVEVDQCD